MCRRLWGLVVGVVVAGGLLAGAGGALAVPIVACNTVITSAGLYELTGNLNCPGQDGVIVNADSVTINLNGFALNGSGSGVGIEVAALADNAYIFGGSIRGFETGVRVGECNVGGLSTAGFALDSVSVLASVETGIELCPQGGSAQVTFTGVSGSGQTGIDANPGSVGVGGQVTLLGVVVRGGLTGIKGSTTPTGRIVIQASRVSNASSTAVSLSGSGYGEFTDGSLECPSRACTNGITISTQSSSSLVARNSISDFARVAVQATGDIFDQPSITIADNTIRRIGGSAIFHGAIVVQQRGAFVTGNALRDLSQGPGIRVACSHGAAVEDNTLRLVAGDGIVVDNTSIPGLPCTVGASDADVVRDNTVRSAAGNGIVVALGLNQQVTDNRVLFSGLDGLVLGSAVVDSFVRDNVARANGDDGFQLDTASLELTGNRAVANSGFGFETTFAGTILADSANVAVRNGAGGCSDPYALPNTAC